MSQRQLPVRGRPRIFAGILLDPVEAKDFNQLKLIYACEDCSHFAAADGSCTLGFNSENHRQESQLHSFALSGRMAICRFLEID